MAGKECIVVLDNGSLRPEATFSLRSIAARLEALVGEPVFPVSLLHSSKIDPVDLGGTPALTWRRFLKEQHGIGMDRIWVLPLFFGPSSAVKDYLPKVTQEILGSDCAMQCLVAEPLVSPDEGDDAVARILHELLIQKLDTEAAVDAVVLVDHGSPVEVVARCRDQVANQLGFLLEDRAGKVIAASMERREGAEYDFNEPLLERALRDLAEEGAKRIALSYLFFSPGRHAGEGGDIDQILDDAGWTSGDRSVVKAPLVSESDGLIPLLALRLRELQGEG